MNRLLTSKQGLGKEYAGWVDYPLNYDKEEFASMLDAAREVIDKADVLVVVGIGGSYLGCKAVLEGIKGSFYYELPDEYPRVLFAGNNISSEYMSGLLSSLRDKEVCVNVISKSGNTTETGISFRIIEAFMKKKYSEEEVRQRIYVTTEKNNSMLRDMAIKEGYKAFSLPSDIGGRYSVLTPVGLFPLACAGIDIQQIMEGALEGYYEYLENDIKKNSALSYALTRNILYRKNKKIEILVTKEPSMVFFAEWWKQLFAESCGKEGKGLFPVSVNYSTDLHSLGQYIQEGERTIFETFLDAEHANNEVTVPFDKKNYLEINYLCNKTLNQINRAVTSAALDAHVNGGVPVCSIKMNKINEFNFGKLLYFFMKSCAVSGYLNDINPFNQPGVEQYKENMFKLLGKPGYNREDSL